MQPSVTLELPLPIYRHLQAMAHRQTQAIPDMLVQLLIQTPSPLPLLPVTLVEELNAFPQLSNEVLWLLARTTLSPEQRTTLAALNRKAQQAEGLTVSKQKQQAALVELCQSTLTKCTTVSILLSTNIGDKVE